jgi:hypothetical protein
MNFKSFFLACSLVLLLGTGAFANNMLVQNVTTLGNDAVNRTIQVQFDISWDNSWRDAINYDAAWIFMKFKDASGVWQHAQLNQTGFVAGTGTANTVQVTADKVGSWLYRSGLGSGTFTSTGMQLQWNYGLAGLTSVTGLEVRVFAVEMVYVPEGEFNCAGAGSRSFRVLAVGSNGTPSDGVFNAPGSNFPVINNRLSPILTYNDRNPNSDVTMRIKGDSGIDVDNNGTVDNNAYPTGYLAFYCFKYELSEQQYADFLNTLTPTQVSLLYMWGTNINSSSGQYFSSTPNRACGYSTPILILSYADWAGIRPMSFLEFNKASYGPIQPVQYCCGGFYLASGGNQWPAAFISGATSAILDVGLSATANSNRITSGASYYGIMDFALNAREPVVKLNAFDFTNQNGNGVLSVSGENDISTWNSTTKIIFIDQGNPNFNTNVRGFRYVRSAE